MDKKDTDLFQRETKSYEHLQQENEVLRKRLDQLEQELLMADSRLNYMKTSRTYQMAQRMERLFDQVVPLNSARYVIVKKAWRLLKRLLKKQVAPQQLTQGQAEELQRLGRYTRMDVVTTNHTMYIARLVARELERLEIECRIHIGEPEAYEDIPYVIICPQFVQRFPKVYFVFQMEQTVSSRWFTEEYLVKLRNACGVLDYSLTNIDFFQKPEYRDLSRSVYYVPIDYYPEYTQKSAPGEKEYDVLFYGDASNPRRRTILEEVAKHFSVKVCSELYGEDVYAEIRKAKVLINIHYYEGALLETTRLFETLSLNSTVIVSEDSEHGTEMERLAQYVDFVPVGDIQALIERIAYWLEHDDERRAKVAANRAELEARTNAFSFYFLRFLLAHDRIDFDEFYRLAGDYVQLGTERICLNLPESTQRRRSFDRDNHYGFACVPGLRHQKGWVGCGLSYKMILTRAKEMGMEHVMICEDDVVFPEDFERQLKSVLEYLASKKRWDLFSGVMADVDDVCVLGYERNGGTAFLEVDRMMSMVFNIYNRGMFDHLIAWNEKERNEARNTIDRYLEEKKLSVHVQLPFLVGHKEELNSTIWDWSNIRYKKLIENSENLLNEKMNECIRKASESIG